MLVKWAIVAISASCCCPYYAKINAYHASYWSRTKRGCCGNVRQWTLNNETMDEIQLPVFPKCFIIWHTCSQGYFIPLKTACKSDAWREHFCLFFKIWPRFCFAPVFGSYESGLQLTLSSYIWSLLYPDVLRFLGKCCIACVWVFTLLSNGVWQRQTGDDLFVLVQMPHCSSQSGFIITEEYWQIRMLHFSPQVHHSNGSCM